MGAPSPRVRSETYRRLVVLLLRSMGLHGVTGKLSWDTLDDAADALESGDLGHVYGLPVSVIVTDQIATRWSESLDLADRASAAAGKLGGAVVQRRKGHEVEGSYVVMQLSTWARLMKEMSK